MNLSELKTVYKELLEQFSTGSSERNTTLLKSFLSDDRIISFKTEETRSLYISLRIARAEAYVLFGDFEKAYRECRYALVYEEKSKLWELYLKWSHFLFLHFSYSKTERDQQIIAEMALQVAKKGIETVTVGADLGYRRMAFTNTIAFFHTYLGNTVEAKRCFDAFLFKPIPIPQYNNNEELVYLFSNYAKALAVAIQLKDEELLRKLLRVISIDDQTLYGEKNLFKMFHSTLLNTIDVRQEFSVEFNSMFRLQGKLGENMNNFDYFLTSIKGNLMEALNTFFMTFDKK